MSLTKLEQVVELLVNEENEQAEELLHDFIVEKSRNIYESIVQEEDDCDDDMDEEMEESIGGDMKQDFTSEIKAAKEDIESDELRDGEVDDDAGEEVSDEMDDDNDYDDDGEHDEHEEDHDDIEGEVEDLRADLDSLRAEFDQLMADEMEEPYHDEEDFEMDMDSGEGDLDPEMDMGDEMDMDMDMEMPEGMYEATKLQNEVPSTGQETESGKLAGTGKHSKTGATGKEAPYTNAPSKSLEGADPVDFTKGSAAKSPSVEKGKDHTPSSNIGEEPSNVSHGEQTGEGEFVGTGKGSKKGKTDTKSPLSSAPKHP